MDDARYELISELGGGGMSLVHVARDRVTGRVVVLKRLSDAAAALPDAQRRFEREASIAEQLRHPNVVATVAVERERGAPVAIVHACVRGCSLRELLATTGALDAQRAVAVLRDVAAALAYVHERHIVHRDVKPANILIDSTTGRAMLADFGIACEAGSLPDVDGDGVRIGTPAYMAPEQIEGRAVDERADVYALALVGWEMLTGRMPWQGDSLEDVLHRQRHEPLPDLAQLRPDIPVFLLQALNGALSKDPAHRWRNAGEMLRKLSATPTPLATPAAAGLSDETVPIDASSLARRPVVSEPVSPAPGTLPVIPRRRARVVATAVATGAFLVLGTLAPRLSHATERRSPSVDPELDSMLTLAVTSRPETPRAWRSPCAPGRITRAGSCTAVAHGTNAASSRRARGRR